MNSIPKFGQTVPLCAVLLLSACTDRPGRTAAPEPQKVNAAAAVVSPEKALPAEKTGGFDGARAWEHVRRQVDIGPRTPGSEGSRRAQAFIRDTLKSFGCAVEEDPFQANTPLGRVEMRNLVTKIPGERKSVILLLTHYDTKTAENFVGANDSGSSTGVMLEMARLLCAAKRPVTFWIAFLDGEEAYGEWSDVNGTFGSRQMAARLALSGELHQIKAVILADLVGERTDLLRFKRESASTAWLKDILWDSAKRLGYEKHFVSDETPIEDDHIPFLRRDVPAVDIIDLEYEHWHTPQDTLDKVSARSLGIVGHVILESLPAVGKRILARR